MLKHWLEHPLARGLDLDDPHTTHLRRRILDEKRFLRRIYEEWYTAIAASLPPGEGAVLELGSGAGFLADFIPGLVRSEVFYTPGIDLVLDGQALPFRDRSLRGIAMTNVLHHLPRPLRFFAEAARAVRGGGGGGGVSDPLSASLCCRVFFLFFPPPRAVPPRGARVGDPSGRA